jgi:hypothetical protein
VGGFKHRRTGGRVRTFGELGQVVDAADALNLSCLLLVGEMLGYPTTDSAATSPPAEWMGLAFVAFIRFYAHGSRYGMLGLTFARHCDSVRPEAVVHIRFFQSGCCERSIVLSRKPLFNITIREDGHESLSPYEYPSTLSSDSKMGGSV